MPASLRRGMTAPTQVPLTTTGIKPAPSPYASLNKYGQNSKQYNKYIAEYQNPYTTGDRRNAIDKAWGYSTNSNITQPKPTTQVTNQGPYSNQTVQQNPDGTYTFNNQLNAQEQSIYNNNVNTVNGMYGVANQLMGQLPTGNIDPAMAQQQREKVQNDLYGYSSGLLDKRFGQEDDAFRQRLAQEGIQEGTQQYQNRLQQLKGTQNDAYAEARNSAVQQGGSEFDRMYGVQKDAQMMPYDKLASVLQGTRGAYDPGQGMADSYLNMQNSNKENAANRQFTASQNALDRKQQAENARRMGGGGAARDPIADYAAISQIDLQNQMLLAGLNGNKKQPNQWMNVLGSLGYGVANGVGSSLVRG